MKNLINHYTRSFAVAVLVAGAGAPAIAAETSSADPGLLGQRYVGAMVDWVSFDDPGTDDGLGVSLAYNHPLNDGVDLSLTYAYLGAEVFGVDVNTQQLLFGGTFHAPMGKGRGFVRGEIGLVRIDAGPSETEVPFVVTAGWQLPVGGEFALTPYINWTDLIDSDLDVDGQFGFGILAEWRPRGDISLLARFESDDDSNVGLSLGAAVRL